MVAHKNMARVIFVLGIAGLFFALFTTNVGAVTSSISQGYKTQDTNLVTGMAASLSSDSTDTERLVVAASTANLDRFVGIITTVEDNLVTLSGSATDVLVSTDGQVPAFVSDLNGEVKRGDFVSISPVNGVLMKSDGSGLSRVVGIAQQDFSEITSEEKQINTSNGQQTIKVGVLKLEISQNVVKSADESEDKTALVLAGESLTGKSVGQIQVLAALVIFAVILIVEGSIIYGAIHSTVTALGRNPLAKKAVFRQLLQVSWIAVVVLIVGFGSIYLILWI
jgi:hypothetical protein